MKTARIFFAGVVSALVTGFVAAEVFIHLVEHQAYTKGAR